MVGTDVIIGCWIGYMSLLVIGWTTIGNTPYWKTMGVVLGSTCSTCGIKIDWLDGI